MPDDLFTASPYEASIHHEATVTPADPPIPKPDTADIRSAGFRGPQVCTIVGITYRQLDYWARTDLLKPSIADAKGSGSQRRYAYTDLLELKVIKQLLDAGVSLRSARKAIECLRETDADVAACNLVLSGTRSVLAQSGEEVIDLLKGGQGVLNIVPLAGVVQEVDAAVELLRSRRDANTEALAGGVPGAVVNG